MESNSKILLMREKSYKAIKNTKLIYANIIFNIALICLLLLIPLNARSLYIQNYLIDAGCLLVLILLYAHYISMHGFDIFDPLGIITFIYGFLYFVTPIYDILIQNYTWFGYRMFPYGVKSGLIALCGYIAFYIFYCGLFRMHRHSPEKEKSLSSDKFCKEEKQQLVIFLILIMYAISFAANVFYLLHSGYTSLLYIMTLGIFGKEGQSVASINSIGFVAMFSYSLPTLVMLYWEYTGKTVATVILFIPMLMMQITRGFRFFIVQIAISFAAYYFISRGRKPAVRHLLILFAVLMVPVLLMTLFRNDVRSGIGISFTGISIETIKKAIDDAIWDNFRIYNNYYGIVHSVPGRFNYVYGRQIFLGTLIMAIPRLIWPNKISSGAGAGLEYIVGMQLKDTGQAYPGLGEYYYAFGIIGVIIFMAAYGLWMRFVKERYRDKKTSGLDTIIFSVLLGANLQILIRGYTPSNFWYVVFSLLPVYVVKWTEKLFRTKEVDINWEKS